MIGRLIKFIREKLLKKKDPKKESYYGLLMSPATANDFRRIFNFEATSAATANLQLQFRDLEWGCGFDEVLRKYLKPSYKMSQKTGSLMHDVWFYKVKTNDLKTITQLHFINGKLVIVTRIYRDLMRQNIPDVLSEIYEEYGVQASVNNNQFSQILDRNGNLMQLSVDFSLQYQIIGNYLKLKEDIQDFF